MSSETLSLVIISYSRPNNSTYSAFRTDKVIGLLAVCTLYMELHLSPRTLAEPYMGVTAKLNCTCMHLYLALRKLNTAPQLWRLQYIKTVGEV